MNKILDLKCAGYQIMRFISFDDATYFVVGWNGKSYATWEYRDEGGFYWGHYGFENLKDAIADMFRRTEIEISYRRN